MIYSENCYIVLNDDNTIAEDYADMVFESIAEAEIFIEKQNDTSEEYIIISLTDFFEDLC